jgi:large subunit ribosomal protein L28
LVPHAPRRYPADVAGCPATVGHGSARPTSCTRTTTVEEIPVAATCDVCGKGPGFGNAISHSHRRTRRRWNPNIQTVRVTSGGSAKRVRACTSCIKAGKVAR